jgi:guanylate kinase
MIEKASLFVIASPSGGGKSSLIKAILEQLDNIEVSISHTTRERRAGEVDGEDYYFVDEEKFDQIKKNNSFIEHANVFGHQYGTSREQIERRLSLGTDVLLDIDWQGARQIKTHFANVVSIFILPPSVETLKQRLLKRQRDDSDTIAFRMEKAQHEIRHHDEFDYLIVNDNFDKALGEMLQIIKAVRLKSSFQALKNQTLLSKLLMSQ